MPRLCRPSGMVDACIGFALLGLLAGGSPPVAAQGMAPEDPAVYRSFPRVSGYRAFLPEQMDLSDHFPQPRDQGEQSSCVGWAVGYALRSYYESLRRGWNLEDEHHLFSPAFLYNRLQNRAGAGGSCGAATRISDALNLLRQGGIVSLADFPYDAQRCERLPDTQLDTLAEPFRIDDWRRIDLDATSALDDVKGQLVRHDPVVFGMEVPDSFRSLAAGQVFDDTRPGPRFGHAMVVVGYSEPRRAFKVINSWGPDWGEGGYGWVSYRAFQELAQAAFVVQPGTVLPPLAAPAAPRPTPAAIAPPPAVAMAPPPVSTAVPVPVSIAAPAMPLPPVPPAAPPLQVVSPQPSPTPLQPALQTVPQTMPIAAATPVAPPLPPQFSPAQAANAGARLRRALDAYQCARLDLDAAPGAAPVVRGFVASEEDRGRLRQELAVLDPDRPIALEAEVAPWPLCEALLTLQAPLRESGGLSVSITHAGPQTQMLQLSQGESLVVAVETPDFPAYLYVTYVDSSGDAIRLYSPQSTLSRALPPHSRILLGAGDDQPSYRIGAPFGREMVVAVASASPLFDDLQPTVETERKYLSDFRAAYLMKSASGKSGRRVAAGIASLITRPQSKPATP
jgi:hypothetical protein